MRTFAFLIFAALASTATAHAADLPAVPVYEVDKATATIKGATLIITAEGKAQGGG